MDFFLILYGVGEQLVLHRTTCASLHTHSQASAEKNKENAHLHEFTRICKIKRRKIHSHLHSFAEKARQIYRTGFFCVHVTE